MNYKHTVRFGNSLKTADTIAEMIMSGDMPILITDATNSGIISMKRALDRHKRGCFGLYSIAWLDDNTVIIKERNAKNAYRPNTTKVRD